MKKLIYIKSVAVLASCAKQNPVPNTGEQFMSDNEMEVSKNRTKDLNTLERTQIHDWIKSQDIKYYPMGMNYWVNIENLESLPRKNNGEKVSTDMTSMILTEPNYTKNQTETQMWNLGIS